MTDLTIVESFDISEETAEEMADQFSENMGLIRDLTFDGRYHLVRWHEEDDE